MFAQKSNRLKDIIELLNCLIKYRMILTGIEMFNLVFLIESTLHTRTFRD